jgi:hypothetical protein
LAKTEKPDQFRLNPFFYFLTLTEEPQTKTVYD